jgi:hypothetical protein
MKRKIVLLLALFVVVMTVSSCYVSRANVYGSRHHNHSYNRYRD